ncbi:MAG: hypothetical protein DID92_2727742982 [Candidatus Nitrotoga sp. SPKER]|nr:MAG: hypothetical protein DID92_2727742982 [Candidatus Nitrotoga sp. SPKER]
MTLAWLTEDSHARIGGDPNAPHFEPLPFHLRANKRNRIPIYEALDGSKLIFLHAMLHDVRSWWPSVAGLFRAPVSGSILLVFIMIAKLTGQWAEMQRKSAIAVSISENNRRPILEFPFDIPLQFCGRSLLNAGLFLVQDPDGDYWHLDSTVLCSVNFIEIQYEGAPEAKYDDEIEKFKAHNAREDAIERKNEIAYWIARHAKGKSKIKKGYSA